MGKSACFCTLPFPMAQVSIKFYYFSQNYRLNSIRKTRKNYWALLPAQNIIIWNHKKLIFVLFMKAFISRGHECPLVMFGFSEIRYSYVTLKVKISNGYLCPFIKRLFKVGSLLGFYVVSKKTLFKIIKFQYFNSIFWTTYIQLLSQSVWIWHYITFAIDV